MRRLALPAVLPVTVALVMCGYARPASAEVQITMQGGRVTIIAKDATVRQILAEWARVGQTTIVNAERIPGSPLTLELRDMPEQQALTVLLRSISGFLIAPRPTAIANASVFDRIIVMPTTVAPAAATPVSSAPPAFSQPVVVQPLPPVPDDDDQPAPGPTPASGQPANRPGPVFVFPQPQVTNPQQRPVGGGVVGPAQLQQPTGSAPPAATFPGAPTTPAPTGVSTPGMVVPAPPQQGPQAGQPSREP